MLTSGAPLWMVSAARHELARVVRMSERAARLRKFHRWVEARQRYSVGAEAPSIAASRSTTSRADCRMDAGRYLGGYLLSGARFCQGDGACRLDGFRAPSDSDGNKCLGIYGFNLNLAAGSEGWRRCCLTCL